MIDSLSIKGFKLFEQIELHQLGRANLIVGQNNTGKSCLLEAIALYAGRSPMKDISDNLSRRYGANIGPWDPEGRTETGTSLTHPLFSLFHNSEYRESESLEIGRIGDANPFRMVADLFERITDDEGFSRLIPFASEGGEPQLAVTVTRGDRQVALITRRSFPTRPRLQLEKFSGEFFTCSYLPAAGFGVDEAAALWDGLIQANSQELVLECLRFIEPSVVDIIYVAGRRSERVPLMRLRDQSPIPMRSMGDGLTRAYHIALAMATSSGGVVLIDEFETGLHWSVQEEIWKTVCRAAQVLGVQIFASTHSRDTIEAFTVAAQDAELSDATIYRLQRHEADVTAVQLPMMNVSASLRAHRELR